MGLTVPVAAAGVLVAPGGIDALHLPAGSDVLRLHIDASDRHVALQLGEVGADAGHPPEDVADDDAHVGDVDGALGLARQPDRALQDRLQGPYRGGWLTGPSIRADESRPRHGDRQRCMSPMTGPSENWRSRAVCAGSVSQPSSPGDASCRRTDLEPLHCLGHRSPAPQNLVRPRRQPLLAGLLCHRHAGGGEAGDCDLPLAMPRAERSGTTQRQVHRGHSTTAPGSDAHAPKSRSSDARPEQGARRRTRPAPPDEGAATPLPCADRYAGRLAGGGRS